MQRVVESFRANQFTPSRYYQFNCHWQTIVGTGALNAMIFGPRERSFEAASEMIETPDGDAFDRVYSELLSSIGSGGTSSWAGKYN